MLHSEFQSEGRGHALVSLNIGSVDGQISVETATPSLDSDPNAWLWKGTEHCERGNWQPSSAEGEVETSWVK